MEISEIPQFFVQGNKLEGYLYDIVWQVLQTFLRYLMPPSSRWNKVTPHFNIPGVYNVIIAFCLVYNFPSVCLRGFRIFV